MSCDCRLKHDFYVEGVCSICRKPRVLSDKDGPEPVPSVPSAQGAGGVRALETSAPDPFDPYVDALMGDGTH